MAMAERIITLREGSIIESGSPSDLLNADGYVTQLNLNLDTSNEINRTRNAETVQKDEEVERVSLVQPTAVETAEEDVRRKQGDASVYMYYFRCSGYAIISWVVILMSIWVFCTEFPSKMYCVLRQKGGLAANDTITAVWLKWWAETNTVEPNRNVGMYLGVFSMLGVLGSAFISVAAW
jgi:ATP-binding cassette, subfamily C (CFTR/MRP), member 1